MCLCSSWQGSTACSTLPSSLHGDTTGTAQQTAPTVAAQLARALVGAHNAAGRKAVLPLQQLLHDCRAGKQDIRLASIQEHSS